MSASLVGSEMCIRDSPSRVVVTATPTPPATTTPAPPTTTAASGSAGSGPCLLYTSDAADDM
eukprot:1613641-Alexandrium_andersonii.AAC.1